MNRLHKLAALIFAASVIAGATDARSERRLALVIGNNEYQQLTPLVKAVADAETYAELFRSKGFDQVTLKTNLTRGAMDEAIAAFVEGIEPGDTAVFSYSGHGWSDGTQNFIIGTDAPNSGSQEFLARISIPLRNGLSGVIDDMDRRGASLKVALIDACRDNPFAPQPGKRGSGMTRGLARTDPPEGTFVIYSAAAAQSSLDRLSDADTNPNGVFTRVFAPLLASDMSLQEAVKEAQQEVVALARSIQEEQKPAYYDEVIGRACLSEACEAETPATAPENTPDEDTWARIASSTDPADFESFARIFPDSSHRSEAEAKAKALREAETEVAALPVVPPDLPAASEDETPDAVPATECDRLAASPYGTENPIGVTPVSLNDLKANAAAAIAACREAVASHPSVRRLLFQLGRALNEGGQVDEAKTWYEKAADLGDPTAMNNLATIYRLADSKDPEAARLYRQAAEAGLTPAMINLGAIFSGGENGVEQSYEEARNWYRKAAELGEVQGMKSLANLYTTGSGGEVDYAEAIAWYEKAAGLGDTEAMWVIGKFYEAGSGVTASYSEARSWFKKAADLGDTEGMIRLATLYETKEPLDHGAARSWYRKAADLGNTVAMTRMGEFYEHGAWALAIDEGEALRWYRKAADLGWGAAMAHLGEFYEKGRGGLSQDTAEARRWYQAAIDNYDASSAATLAFMYATGVGGPKDNQLASKTFLFGMAYGYPEFYERLKAEASSLDPEVWRDIQSVLIQEGVLSGGADGKFGEETSAALDAYRRKYWGDDMTPER